MQGFHVPLCPPCLPPIFGCTQPLSRCRSPVKSPGENQFTWTTGQRECLPPCSAHQRTGRPGRRGIPEGPQLPPGPPQKRGEKGKANPSSFCSQITTSPGNKLSRQNGWHLTRNMSVQVSSQNSTFRKIRNLRSFESFPFKQAISAFIQKNDCHPWRVHWGEGFPGQTILHLRATPRPEKHPSRPCPLQSSALTISLCSLNYQQDCQQRDPRHLHSLFSPN